MESVGRQLNGLILSFATDNKELWLMVLNQTWLLLYLVSFRALFFVTCCSLCIYCKFGNFRVTFISQIFYFRIDGEFLNSRVSVLLFYKVYSDSFISENFEFKRQPIREYWRKLSSREYFRIYSTRYYLRH